MPFESTREFVQFLESQNDLHRITAPVDPVLEMTEIADRCLKNGDKALLFENPVGSEFPVAMNLYATRERLEKALGYHPSEIGERLVKFADWIKKPNLKNVKAHIPTIKKGLKSRPKAVSSGAVMQMNPQADITSWPILQCWPGDSARYVTLPQVVTMDPENGEPNMGMYRMQVNGPAESGMHIQIERGAGVHLHKAETMGVDLPMSVSIGGDPLVAIGAAAPLPEGLSELQFLGFLRGKPLPVMKSAEGVLYPANADFVMHGVVPAGLRQQEGPFGDHFGHYSHRGLFPVFRINKTYHRRDAIYPATIVGIPPKEDKVIGWAVSCMLTPLIKLIKPEVTAIYAYPESGFHSLAAASVHQRYEKECMKTAMGLLGEGQFSLTKCLVMLDHDQDPSDIISLSHRLHENFDPEEDFIMMQGVPFDTLDFTSLTLNIGSKMILDATTDRKKRPNSVAPKYPEIEKIDSWIKKSRWIGPSILVLWSDAPKRQLAQDLLKKPAYAQEKIIAVVSDDVDPSDIEQVIWGIFTRFEPARDVFFENVRMDGIKPVYSGRMAIDATWKDPYPNPVVMSDEIIAKVDLRWNEYFSK